MKKCIVIFTHTGETSVDVVVSYLKKMGEHYIRLNTDRFPVDPRTSLSVGLDKNSTVSFHLQGQANLNTENIKSCWSRQPGVPQTILATPYGYERLAKEESKATLWSLYTSMDTFWMNNPLATRSLKDNKLHQMKAAVKIGFRIPDSIITTKADDLIAFCEIHGGEVALKMISGHVFNTGDVKNLDCVYTQKISMEEIKERKERIRWCPDFDQEYIPKKVELRVTVVNNAIFPCLIHSQESKRTLHDWRRYDFEKVKHEKTLLPVEIENKIIKLMQQLNLSFGAFDFILTPDDEYVFLEVNSSGQWGWIEDITKMPISEAIANTLANPPKS